MLLAELARADIASTGFPNPGQYAIVHKTVAIIVDAIARLHRGITRRTFILASGGKQAVDIMKSR